MNTQIFSRLMQAGCTDVESPLLPNPIKTNINCTYTNVARSKQSKFKYVVALALLGTFCLAGVLGAFLKNSDGGIDGTVAMWLG